MITAMDVYGIFIDRLRSIERLYDGASGAFRQRKTKIDAQEAPYEVPSIDPDRYDGEPPFLEEWLEADEFENVIGQACLSIAHSCLRDYFDGVVARSGIAAEAEAYLRERRKDGWFKGYIALFREAYGIDWTKSPTPVDAIEEINLMRNDMQHGEPALGLARYRNTNSVERFPFGLFVDDVERNLSIDARFARTYVSHDAFGESIKRLESFCGFVEACTRSKVLS